MNLKEKYQNKVNNLLNRLDEEWEEEKDAEEEIRAAQDNPEPNGENGAEEEMNIDTAEAIAQEAIDKLGSLYYTAEMEGKEELAKAIGDLADNLQKRLYAVKKS